MLDPVLSWSLSALSSAADPVEFANCFRFVNDINGLPERIKELFGKQRQDTRYHTVLPTVDALIVDCSSILRQHHSKSSLNFSLSKEPLIFDLPKTTTPYRVGLELFTLVTKLLAQRKSAQYVVLVFDKDIHYDGTMGRDDAIDITDPRIHSLLPDILLRIATTQPNTVQTPVHAHTLIIDGNNCSSRVASILNKNIVSDDNNNKATLERDKYDYPCVLVCEGGVVKYTIEHPDWQWSIQRASHTGGSANHAILYYLYMLVTEMDTIPNYDTYNIEIIGSADVSGSPLSQLLLIAVHNLRLYKTGKFKLHVHFKPLHCNVDIEMVKLHQLLCKYLLDNIYGATLAFVFSEKDISTYYQSRLTRENFVFTEFLMLTTLSRLIHRPIETLIESWVRDVLESQPKELATSFYQTYSMVAIDFNYKVVAVNTVNVALFVVSLLLSEDPKYKYKAYTGGDTSSNLTAVYYGAIEDAQDIYNIGMAQATVKSLHFNKALDTSLSKSVLAVQWTAEVLRAVTEARGYDGFVRFWKLLVAPIVATSNKFKGNLYDDLWKSGDAYFLKRLFLLWLLGPRKETTAEYTSMKQLCDSMIEADKELTQPLEDVNRDDADAVAKSEHVSKVISEEIWDVFMNVFDAILIAPILDRIDPYDRITNICKQCDPFTDKSALTDTVTLNISSCRQEISQVLSGIVITTTESADYIPLLSDLMATALIDCIIVKFRAAIDSLPSTAFLSAENMKIFAQSVPKRVWWHLIDDLLGHTDYYTREHVRSMLYANDWGYGSKRLANVPFQREYYTTSSNNAIHNGDLDLIYNELDRERLPVDIRDNIVDDSIKNNDQELPRLYRGWYDLKSLHLKNRQELLPTSRLYMGINSQKSLPYYLREELTKTSGRRTAYSLPFKMLQLSPYPVERREADELFVSLERIVRVLLEKMPRFGKTNDLDDSYYSISSAINGTANSDTRRFVNTIVYSVLGYRMYVPSIVATTSIPESLVPSFTLKETIFLLDTLRIVFRYDNTEDTVRFVGSLSNISTLFHCLLDLKLLCGQDQWIGVLWQYLTVQFEEIKTVIDSQFAANFPTVTTVPADTIEYIKSFRYRTSRPESTQYSLLLLTQALRIFLICIQRDFVISKNDYKIAGAIKMTHDSLKYLVHFGFDPLPKTLSSYTLTLAECNRAIEMTYDQVRDEAKDDLLDPVPRYSGSEAVHASHLLESVKQRVSNNNNNNNNTTSPESRPLDVIKDDFDGSHRLVIRVASDGSDTTYKLEQKILTWILRHKEIIYLSQLLDSDRYNWVDWFCSALEDRQTFAARKKEETDGILDGFERWTFTRRRFVDLTTDMKIVQLPYFDVIRNMPYVSINNITQASQRTMIATLEWLHYNQQQAKETKKQRIYSIVLRENTQYLQNRMKINDVDTIPLPKVTDYVPCPWGNWINIQDPFLSLFTGDCINERLSDLRARYTKSTPSTDFFPSQHGIYYEVYCVNSNLSTRDVDAMYLYGVRFGYNWCKKLDADKINFLNFLHKTNLVNQQMGGLIWKKPESSTTGTINLFMNKKQQLPKLPLTTAIPYDTEAFVFRFLESNWMRYRSNDWYSPLWDIGQGGKDETSEYTNSILFQMDALEIPSQTLTEYTNNRGGPHIVVKLLETAFYRSDSSIDASMLIGDVKTVVYEYLDGMGVMYSSWLSKWYSHNETKDQRASVYAHYDEMLLLKRYSALACVLRGVTMRLDAIYLLASDVDEIAGYLQTLLMAHFDQLSGGVFDVSLEGRAEISRRLAAFVAEYAESTTEDIPIKMATPESLYLMGVEVDVQGNELDPQDKQRLELTKRLLNAKDPLKDQGKVSRVKMQRVIDIVQGGSWAVDREHGERVDAGEVPDNLKHSFEDYKEGEDELDRLKMELEQIRDDPSINKRTKAKESARVRRKILDLRQDIAIGNKMVDIIVNHGPNYDIIEDSYMDMYVFLGRNRDLEGAIEEDSVLDQLVATMPLTSTATPRSAPITPADKERKYRRTINNLLHRDKDKQGSLELYFLFELDKIPPHYHILSKKAYIPTSNKIVIQAGYSLLQSVIVCLSGAAVYDRKSLMKIADVSKLTQQTQNTLALLKELDSIQDDEDNNNNNNTTPADQGRKDALKRLYSYLKGKTGEVANAIEETTDVVNIEEFAKQLASVCMVTIKLYRISLIDARKGSMSYIKTTSINDSANRVTLDILLYSYRNTKPPRMTYYACEPLIKRV
jgi:hypothetical protein